MSGQLFGTSVCASAVAANSDAAADSTAPDNRRARILAQARGREDPRRCVRSNGVDVFTRTFGLKMR